MITRDNVLVVVDPAHSEHVALNRAVQFAGSKRYANTTIHVVVGFEGYDMSDSQQAEEAVREREWLDKLLAPLEQSGVEFKVNLVWTRKWEKSIIDATRRTESELIIITRSSAINKTGITDSCWSLLRKSDVPVLTVESDTPARRKNILVAVNMQSTDPEYEALNRKVLLQGKDLAEFYDAKLHVVNAYQDAQDYPDRDKVKRILDIKRKDIQVDMGKPEDVIASVVDNVDADLVIMGTKSRQGLRATLRGNTSEKIISKLKVDVLTLN